MKQHRRRDCGRGHIQPQQRVCRASRNPRGLSCLRDAASAELPAASRQRPGRANGASADAASHENAPGSRFRAPDTRHSLADHASLRIGELRKSYAQHFRRALAAPTQRCTFTGSRRHSSHSGTGRLRVRGVLGAGFQPLSTHRSPLACRMMLERPASPRCAISPDTPARIRPAVADGRPAVGAGCWGPLAVLRLSGGRSSRTGERHTCTDDLPDRRRRGMPGEIILTICVVCTRPRGLVCAVCDDSEVIGVPGTVGSGGSAVCAIATHSVLAAIAARGMTGARSPRSIRVGPGPRRCDCSPSSVRSLAFAQSTTKRRWLFRNHLPARRNTG